MLKKYHHHHHVIFLFYHTGRQVWVTFMIMTSNQIKWKTIGRWGAMKYGTRTTFVKTGVRGHKKWWELTLFLFQIAAMAWGSNCFAIYWRQQYIQTQQYGSNNNPGHTIAINPRKILLLLLLIAYTLFFIFPQETFFPSTFNPICLCYFLALRPLVP